jgi:hypothetical protein
LAAVQRAADADRIAVDPHTRWYAGQLATVAREYIHGSTIPRGRSLEILTSFRSGETNSESEPWMLLGLFPIDPIIAEVQPRGQAKEVPSRRVLVGPPALEVDLAAGGLTTENQLVLSTVPSDLGRGIYRVTINLGAEVCPNNGISPIVLNVLYHRDGSIVKIEPVEPSSRAECESGSLEFEFPNQDQGLLELNVYTRRGLSLPHAPVIKHLERMTGRNAQ